MPHYTAPEAARFPALDTGGAWCYRPEASIPDSMTYDPLSRRRFVGTGAAALATVWLTGASRPWLPTAAGVLPVPALRDFDAISALILPSDDLPGAREAKVVDFIDRALGSFAAEQRPIFDAGLADLNGRVARRFPGVAHFADLAEADAVPMLRELETEGSEFFEVIRLATITGFLANPEYGGNAGKVGWKVLGFEDRFIWSAPFGWYDANP